MDVLVCGTACGRHPTAPVGVVPRVRNAVLDGNLSRVVVLGEVEAPDADGPARWPGVVEWSTPAGEGQRDRMLASTLLGGTGSMLVCNCACDVRASTLAAFSHLGCATALVTDQPDHPGCAAALTHRKGRHVLLHGLDTVGDTADSGTGPRGPGVPPGPDAVNRGPASAGAPVRTAEALCNFLGVLLLTDADRRLLAEMISSRACRRTARQDALLRFPWQDAIDALALRAPIQCVVLTRDVHGGELIVGGSLAGGSHARTCVRLGGPSGRRTVHKEAAGVGLSKLNDEITWLRGLDNTAGRHFPDIVEHRIEPHCASMDLAFHQLPTLRQLILAEEIDEEEAADWTRRVLAVLRRDLYPAGRRPAPTDYVPRTHLDRIESRLVQTAAALPERHQLWTADSLLVNRVRLRSARVLIAELARDERALRMLTPDTLVRTHGDPHFDNILIDRQHHRFLLIDPRGNPGYDPAYDLAKVWHSVNSLYDLIHTGHVEVVAGADHIDYAFTSPRLVAFYHRVRERVHAWLTATGWYQDDPYWLLKVRLAEAAHMCSVMPFHICHDQRETVALACYARGLELINDLHRDLAAADARARPARADGLGGPLRTAPTKLTDAGREEPAGCA